MKQYEAKIIFKDGQELFIPYVDSIGFLTNSYHSCTIEEFADKAWFESKDNFSLFSEDKETSVQLDGHEIRAIQFVAK